MRDCLNKLFQVGTEEGLEILCRLFFIIGKDIDTDAGKVIRTYHLFTETEGNS